MTFAEDPEAEAKSPPPLSPFQHAPLLPTVLLLVFWAACILAQAAYFQHLKPLAQAICIAVQLAPITMRNSSAGRVASAFSIVFVLLTVGIGVSTELADLLWPPEIHTDYYKPHPGPLIAGAFAGILLTAILAPLYLRSRLREADRDAQTMLVSCGVLILAAGAFALRSI